MGVIPGLPGLRLAPPGLEEVVAALAVREGLGQEQ